MSSRLAVIIAVCVASVAAAGTVVGVTLATRQTPVQPQMFEGAPPLPDRNLPTPVAAEIRAAYETWPDGSVDEMRRLAREHPDDPAVQFYLGLALIWAGYQADAVPPLRAAKVAGRDTFWEVQADDLLHPEFNAGYPVFELAHPDPLIAEGARLQQLGKRHSAVRMFDRAVKKSPDDEQALVAAAVARFDKGNPTAAFSRLGPLTRRFPEGQIVRFYLGLLLAWSSQRDAAIEQFDKAVALGPNTKLGQGAALFLQRVEELEEGHPSPEAPAGDSS